MKQTRLQGSDSERGSVLPEEEITAFAYGGFRSERCTVRHSLPSAAAIVLPGGAFQRKESWGPLKSLLADTFSVVTVDLPGWGEADLLPESYGIDFLTDSLQVLLRFAGHHAVHLFGGSYGSAIAYRYVQKYPCAVHSPVFAGNDH